MGGLTKPAYRLTPEEVLRELKVEQKSGLTKTAWQERLKEFGSNSIPKRSHSILLAVLAERVRDLTFLLLIAASVISYLIGHSADTIIIAAVLVVDLILTYAQVWRTQRTLERLRQHVEQQAQVLRKGRLTSVSAKQLVPGDIIEFRAGHKIPADARLIKTQGLMLAESALTGESNDVAKSTKALQAKATLANRSNMVFMGTTVMAGAGTAVITATGTRTAIGAVAQMIKEQRSPETPLRRQLKKSTSQIALAVIALVVGIVSVSVINGTSWLEAARIAITLIVGVIPEDLPIIMTIALTVGVVRILKNRGVVRNLSSAETLGAASVICTDKTGTLTLGHMTATELDLLQGQRLKPGGRADEPILKLALTGLALASDAHRVAANEAKYYGSATERASLKFTESFGLKQQELASAWRERARLAFSTEWKYRASLRDHPTQSSKVLFVNGAPDELLERSSQCLDKDGQVIPLTSANRAQILKHIEAHAADGNRLLGTAVRRHYEADKLGHADVKDLLLLGVVLITDPVRPDVSEALQQAQSAGVNVKLITGDHAATALHVAKQVGLSGTADTILSGDDITSLPDEELAQIVDETTIFARVTPLDKQRIIKALQSNGHVVAMTGDGVNDSVALKSADIGVAMGSGKDIAKDSADLVLLDNNFNTIVASIKEGRVIRDNIRKAIAFLLATNAAEAGIFIASLALRLPLPLLPAQILWINVVTDGTSDIALTLEPAEENVMKRRPEDPKKPMLSRSLLQHVLFSGTVFTIIALGLYWYLVKTIHADMDYTRTVLFSFLALASLASTWSFTSFTKSMFGRGLLRNKWLYVSASFSFALQLLAIYNPGLQKFFGTVALNLSDWIVISVLALLAIILIDMRKLWLKPVSN